MLNSILVYGLICNIYIYSTASETWFSHYFMLTNTELTPTDLSMDKPTVIHMIIVEYMHRITYSIYLGWPSLEQV